MLAGSKCFFLAMVVFAVGNLGNRSYLVPTYQRVSISPRDLLFFGRPVDLAIDPTGATLAVKTSHGVVLVDLPSFTIRQILPLPRLTVDFPSHLGGNAPAGILWSADGNELWDTDAFSDVHGAHRLPSGAFAWLDDIRLPNPPRSVTANTDANDGNTVGPAPIGLYRLDPHLIAVTLSRSNAIAVVDEQTHRVLRLVTTGAAPFGIAGAHGRLYVSNWGGTLEHAACATANSSGTAVCVDAVTGVADSGTVSVIDGANARVTRAIAVGVLPAAIVSSHDGDYVYVANSGSDSVSAIDTQRNAVAWTLALGTARGYRGIAPTALAVSADDRTLYVAEGGANRIAAVDLPTRAIHVHDTAWYPSALARSGDSLYVADLKGIGSRGRDAGLPQSYRLDRKGGYNVYDYSGALQRIPVTAWPPASTRGPAAATAPLQRRIFQHVVFIIKENHTYDDIYGDLRPGNGDPRLCLFCETVTPNQHALARRFGAFDNFYVNGTLSADGHNWTDEGDATDYLERSLAGWARSYPSSGNDPLAYSPAGFIWNRVIAKGLTFRDYGEFVPDVRYFYVDGVRRRPRWAQVYADYVRGTHHVRWRQEVAISSLRPYVDLEYPSFSLRIPDQYRASAFIRDFRRLAERHSVPSLMLLALGNDHTAYASPGFPTPDAFAADNDLALARIVGAISRSSYWPGTVIFVVEDDAQDGTDHVDGHRTAALVISAHNRSGMVDSHFYNQTSILHTIESIFDLKPMTLFDADAPVIVAPFGQAADLRPFDPLPEHVRLTRLNPSATAVTGTSKRYALESAGLSVDTEDAANPAIARSILHGMSAAAPNGGEH